MKSDRELLAQAYYEGKILGWWRDHQQRCFSVHLPGDRIGHIPVARVAEVLATLPVRPRAPRRLRAGAHVPAHERRHIDLGKQCET